MHLSCRKPLLLWWLWSLCVCTFCPLCHYFGKLIWYICTLLQFMLYTKNFTICPKHVLGIIKLMFIGYEMCFVMFCARLHFSPYHVCVCVCLSLKYAYFEWSTKREPQVGQLSNYDNGMLHIYQNISAKWSKDDKVYSYNWARTMNIL